MVYIEFSHKQLGFDDATDEEMISEFKGINQKLRQYKFTKQDQIVEHDTYRKMAKEVENLLSKAAEYADTRELTVYNFMRDDWLRWMHAVLMQAAQQEEIMMEPTEEEGEDGWQ